MEQKWSKTAKMVQHNGVDLIVSDFTGMKDQELTEGMKENTRAIRHNIGDRHDWVMVNLFKDCFLNQEAVEYIFQIRKAMEGTFVASAIVGMTAIQKAVYQISIGPQKSKISTEFFHNQVEAMDWAAKEYKKFKAPTEKTSGSNR